MAAELIVENLASSAEFRAAAIETLSAVSTRHRAEICEQLMAMAETLESGERARVYDALRDKLADHREHSDAWWSLPEDELAPLQAACDALAPDDPASRWTWLFASDWVTLGDFQLRDDYKAYDAELRHRRATAIGDIIAFGGLQSVLGLASGTDYPGLVGFALADVATTFDGTMLDWLTHEDKTTRTLAAGYLQNRLAQEGPSLRDALLATTANAETQASVLRLTNDPLEAWKKLDTLDSNVTEAYWLGFVYLGLGPDFIGVHKAARSMLAVGRAAACLHMMALYTRKDKKGVEAAEIVASGFEALIAADIRDPEWSRLTRHQVQRLFAVLSNHSETLGLQRVIELEWRLYPIIGANAQALTLHSAMVADPALFAELVAVRYGPETTPDEGSGEQSSPAHPNAGRADEILRSCALIPGISSDGELDPSLLAEWVQSAREATAASDRLRGGDRLIGALLANAPPASDDTPIHEAVRDLLEVLRNEDVCRGLETAMYNSRSSASRGIYEGGLQERDLANSYLEYAAAAKSWPVTRSVFQGLAASYESVARMLEAEAERRRQGMAW